MRKNNTIYKHTFQTFIIFLLLLCMIPCLPADASPFETSVSVSDTDNDILSIETRASDIGWRYKSVNGVLYKRKYDYTLRNGLENGFVSIKYYYFTVCQQICRR